MSAEVVLHDPQSRRRPSSIVGGNRRTPTARPLAGRFCSRLLTAFALVLWTVTAHAESAGVERALERAHAQDLAADPRWLDLLHYREGEEGSAILSDDFFLSEEGARSPTAELAATIRAYFTSTEGASDDHPRCQFPARYLWLTTKLQLPDYQVIPQFCSGLAEWASLEEVDSISLLLVSGYLGNPASAFGHSLLRINSGEGEQNAAGLLDLAVTFGAVVPENEGAVTYILRGLFGGYVAGFSDQRYYTHDLTYTRTEFRDIWDYRLELSRFQERLLVLHLWEIATKHFPYYFLTRNCSSRLADLLGLALQEPFNTKGRAAYVPVELFHRLHELDRQRGDALIESVRYVPSSQRTMYQQFAELAPADRRIANDVIANSQLGPGDVPKLAASDHSAVAINDALLTYYDYRVQAEKPDVSASIKDARADAVRTRFRLPASQAPDPEVPDRPSPAQGSAPMMLGVGGVWFDESEEVGLLQWSPFYYDTVGFNGLENGELVVFDTSIHLDGDRSRLDKIDLLRIRSLNARATEIATEGEWAWNLRLGMERSGATPEAELRGVFKGGVGLARPLAESVVGYVSLDGWGYTNPADVAIDPNAGLRLQHGDWSGWLRAGVRVNEESEKWREHATLEVAHRLSQHRSIEFSAGYDGLAGERAERVSLMLRQHF